MRGADKFAPLFKTGQYGCMYIVSGSHARGQTFFIQVLPPGEAAIPNGSLDLCLNSSAVVVYGIVSGTPGWDEAYGWLKKGPWVRDFMSLVGIRKRELAAATLAEALAAREEKQEQDRIESRTLDAYVCTFTK